MDFFEVVIEIPQGSNEKYEYDEASKEMKLNFVFKDLVYPYNYGFVPNTLAGDGDPLDVIVLSSSPLKRGETVKCAPIGVLEMLDRNEVDNKIIAVLSQDPLEAKIKDIGDINDITKEQWKIFWAEVARQKNKTIEVQGFVGKESALEEIKKSSK